MKKHVKLFIVILFTLSSVQLTQAQFGFNLGGNISDVTHRHLLVDENSENNTKPILGSLSGMSFQFYPFKHQQNMSFSIELLLNEIGYKQQFSDTSFIKRLNYIAVPLLFNYDVTPKLSLNTGVTLSGLLLPVTVFHEPDNSFNLSDVGLSLGAEYKIWNHLNIFTRCNYSIFPILNYYKIDELGNITPTKDVRNISLMVGLKLNLIYEKIKFF